MNRRIISLLLAVAICFGVAVTGVRPLATEIPSEVTAETPVEATEETQGETTEETQGETTEETPDALPTFTTSKECIELLKFEEGFCEKPYWDYVQYTVGYGTRCPDDKVAYYTKYGITKAEAEELLRVYLNRFESYLNNDLIKKYNLTLTQNQFDALLLLSYNCGPDWIYSETNSNLRKAVISGATGSEMVDRFSRWCKAGGEIKTYLLRRRLCEANIYLNGVYAQVIPQNLGYVLYDANGGTTSVSVQGFDAVQTAQILPTPTYEGYIFDGWYTDRLAGEKVTILDSKVRNMWLYARWLDEEGQNPDSDDADSIKVTVDTQELLVRKGPGTNYAIVGSLYSGQQVSITKTEEGGGYTWGKCSKGWICLKYTDYDQIIKDNEKEEEETPAPQQPQMGTVKVSSYLCIRQGPSTGYSIVGKLYNDDRVEILEQKIAGHMVWGKIDQGWISMEYVELDQEEEPPANEPEPEKYSYILTYYANYQGAEPVSVKDGENVTDSLETEVVFTVDGNFFNREGYTFAGWATSAGGEVVYQADAKVTLNKDAQSLNLYAVWTENKPEPEKYNYTLIYFANYQGANPASLKDSESVADSLETEVVFTVDSNSFNREGYTFAGWATSAGGEAVYQPNAQVTLNKDAQSLNLYAVWTENEPEPEPETKVWTGKVKVSSYLIVRSGPDTSYKALTTISNNTRVTITEQTTTGSMTWGKISSGWICMNYVELDTAPDAPAETVKGTVNVSSYLRVRSQASISSTIVGYLNAKERVEILEQKTVAGTVWGRISTGWIDLSYVILDAQPDEPEKPAEPETVTMTVNTACLRVRSQANTSSSIVGFVYAGAKITISEQKTVNGSTWGKTSSGWVCMDYLK